MLDAETAQKDRLYARFSRESILIMIAGVGACLSLVAVMMAAIATDKANGAIATATTWQTMYKEAERESRLAQLEIDDFRIALSKQGIELDHEDKP